MKSLLLPVLLFCLGLPACKPRDSLEARKVEVKEKYEVEDHRWLLEEVPVGRVEVKPAIPTLPTSEIAVKGAMLRVLKEDSREDSGRSSTLSYPAFKAKIIHARGGGELGSLPLAWGDDDIEKTWTFMRGSGDTIDSATTKAELEDAVARLAAKASLAPLGASARTDWIDGPAYEGLLCGDFKEGRLMTLLARPKDQKGVNYRIDLWAPIGSDQSILSEFLAALKIEVKEYEGILHVLGLCLLSNIRGNFSHAGIKPFRVILLALYRPIIGRRAGAEAEHLG